VIRNYYGGVLKPSDDEMNAAPGGAEEVSHPAELVSCSSDIQSLAVYGKV